MLLGMGMAAMASPSHAVSLPPTSLRELAAHASQRQTWPQLRNYAKNQTDPEWSGWAYFLAGYQEFQAQVYRQAAEDLAEAAKNEFALADYAVFYQASSLRQDNRPQDVAIVLQDFASRFPHSRLLDQVLAMRASALLSAGQAQAAVDALLAEPATHKLPALALLLGQAYMQAQHLGEAAATLQNVYYNFPLSNEAKPAADALSALRNQLGIAYPHPVEEWQIARVETLFKAGRYADALDEYGDLLKSETSSPLAPRWQLGRARCLWRLQRSADALQVLSTHYDTPELESQRLALLVHIHAQQSDVWAVTQDLAQLDVSYSSSPAYAEALSAAGMYYYRQLSWQDAARIPVSSKESLSCSNNSS